MPETIFGLPSFAVLWGGIMILFVAAMLVFAVLKNKRVQSDRKNFFENHPDAAKIYAMSKGFVTSDVVQIHAVDGMPPVILAEVGKSGIYIAPGEHTLTVSSTYTRPGVMYKTVSKSTGTVEKIVTVTPYAEYDLTFDRKEGTFAFTERPKTEAE